jgi:hypothetical protein
MNVRCVARVNRALVSATAVVLCGLSSTTVLAQPGGRRPDPKPAPVTSASGPTPAERAAATDAFRTCREMAKEGDPTACWRLWLKKHKDTGSEAEVAYAEEHQGQARLVEATQAAPSGVKQPDAPPTAATPPTTPAGAPSASGAPAMVPGSVLDFCALTPRTDSSRFVKQRVVVFAPSGAEQVEDDAEVRGVRGGSLIRGVFAARFPLDRFHNVVTTRIAKPTWATSTSITLDEITTHLKATRPQAADGGVGEPNQEEKFLGYSLACADYVVAPAITSHKGEWTEQEVKTKKGGKRKVRTFTLKLESTLGIFRREGTTFKQLRAIRSTAPTLLDLATDATAGAIPDVKVPELSALGIATAAAKVAKVPPHISAIPEGACTISDTAKEGVAGLKVCPAEGHHASILNASSVDERASEVCKAASGDEKAPEEMKAAMVACEVRVRAFQLARTFGKEARSVEGWQLFAPVQVGTREDKGALGMSLGGEEGVKVGYGFVAVNGSHEPLGYVKATRVGPGGEAGIKDPTEIALRSGEAPEGARLEEYPQFGIGIMPYGSFGLLTWNYGATTSNATTGKSVYLPPKLMTGGALNVGFDLSGALGLNETYLRIGAGYFAGVGGSNMSMGVIPIDVAIEKGFYLGNRLTFYLSVGESTTIAKAKLTATAEGNPEQDLTAVVAGANARLGFDVMFTPAVAMRLEGMARVHFNKASYSEKDDKPLVDGWDKRVDHYLTLGPNLAFAFTF